MKIRLFNLVFLLLLLVACSDGETGQNTIQHKNLTDENRLLKAVVGEMSYYFEYTAEKGKFLEVWVERYEYGKMVERTGDVGVEMIENEKGEIFIYLLDDSEWKKYYLRSVIMDESGYAMTSAHIAKPNNNYLASTYGTVIHGQVPMTEDMLLGYIVFFEPSNVNSISISMDYTNPHKLIEENQHAPVIYLIRASLTDDGMGSKE